MRFPIDRPVRCLITRGVCASANFNLQRDLVLETIDLAVAARLELVEIREKLLPTTLLFGLSAAAADVVRGSATKLLINERFDVAIAAGADGVHLTSTSIPVEQVRGRVPRDLIIGVSTHAAEEVAAAKAAGADYAIFGPVFSTPGKEDAKGLDMLAKVCRGVSPFPVLAIGGIDDATQDSVLAAGASGFASIRYLNDFVRIAK